MTVTCRQRKGKEMPLFGVRLERQTTFVIKLLLIGSLIGVKGWDWNHGLTRNRTTRKQQKVTQSQLEKKFGLSSRQKQKTKDDYFGNSKPCTVLRTDIPTSLSSQTLFRIITYIHNNNLYTVNLLKLNVNIKSYFFMIFLFSLFLSLQKLHLFYWDVYVC